MSCVFTLISSLPLLFIFSTLMAQSFLYLTLFQQLTKDTLQMYTGRSCVLHWTVNTVTGTSHVTAAEWLTEYLFCFYKVHKICKVEGLNNQIPAPARVNWVNSKTACECLMDTNTTSRCDSIRMTVLWKSITRQQGRILNSSILSHLQVNYVQGAKIFLVCAIITYCSLQTDIEQWLNQSKKRW